MTIKTLIGAILATTCMASPLFAQDAFEHGWTLDGEASNLNFLSVKKGSVMEVSTFATLTGEIDETGKAEFKVLLDSIDTKVDLRNVRLRFLLFETFQFPAATVTTNLTREMLADLEPGEETVIELPFTLDLHGFQKEFLSKVSVQLSDHDNVRVTSVDPIILSLSDFNMMAGRDKLQEAAEVTIVPTTAVSFDLQYARNTQSTPVLTSQIETENVAIETAGNLSQEECLTRFETVSQNDNISFEVGSSVLASSSLALLNTVSNIVQRCPEMRIEVAGHTDSFGAQDFNLTLSEVRAAAVVDFLKEQGVDELRLKSKGYGETRPIASNNTRSGRSKNRRIEFSVIGFETASN